MLSMEDKPVAHRGLCHHLNILCGNVFMVHVARQVLLPDRADESLRRQSKVGQRGYRTVIKLVFPYILNAPGTLRRSHVVMSALCTRF